MNARTIPPKVVFALFLAVLLSAATVAIGRFAVLSDNPAIDAAQKTVMVLLLPGLIGVMAVAGNIHAYDLWLAAVINGVIYFGLCWLACTLLARLSGKKTTPQ
jgi:hypothetical protein